MKKIIIFGLVILLIMLGGCAKKSEIPQILNLDQEKFSIYETHKTPIKYPDYILNKENNELINPMIFCEDTDDCISYYEECANDAFIKGYENLAEVYAKIPAKKECACYNNRCFYNGGIYEWISKNTNEDDVILTWWDYGNSIELINRQPVISKPSIILLPDLVATCSVVKDDCKTYFKDLETDEKIKDISKLYASFDFTQSLCIAAKYNVDYILVNKNLVSSDFYPVFNMILEKFGEQETDLEDSFVYKLYFLENEINFAESSFTDDYENKLFKIIYPKDINQICSKYQDFLRLLLF